MFELGSTWGAEPLLVPGRLCMLTAVLLPSTYWWYKMAALETQGLENLMLLPRTLPAHIQLTRFFERAPVYKSGGREFESLPGRAIYLRIKSIPYEDRDDQFWCFMSRPCCNWFPLISNGFR